MNELWTTCAGWSVFGLLLREQRRAHSKSASTRCYTAPATCLSLSPSFFLSSLSLLLHSSTFTSLLSVCQHFPSGGVRHGVRAPGLPASASSHCDLQPRHLSSACQCRSRPLLGFYTESLHPCQEESFLVVWPILNRNALCNGSKGTTERAPITDLC